MANVLVCDDDPTVLRMISATLEKNGHLVTVAKDGLDALVIIKKNKPDVLLLDIMMPELNGYDVCQAIKFDVNLKSLPIILTTSRDQEIEPRLGALMGIDYLHKSCSPAELLDKVNGVLAAGNVG